LIPRLPSHLPRLAGCAALLALVLTAPAPAGEARSPLEKRASPAAEATRPGLFEVVTIKNVPYYQGPDADRVKHRLDLFLPRGHKDYPVLFFVHGGAWLHGDKSFLGIYSGLGAFYARHGIGAVVINYRLSPAVTHPEHAKDVARAFAWTHHHIAHYGGRPDEVFVCGHSAGGHLIALLVTDERYLKSEGLDTHAIRGAIPLSGLFNVPDNFLPVVFGSDPDRHRQASPIRHVHPGLPPFLVLYADRDLPGCNRAGARAFCKALRGKGDKAETFEAADSNHYKILLSAGVAGNPVSQAILTFITAHTDGQTPIDQVPMTKSQ
jgi:acetyl esterase/lipase